MIYIYTAKYCVCQPPIVSFSSVASKALLQKSPLTLWMMLFPCLDLNSGHVRQATALEMRLKKYCKSHFSLQLLLIVIGVKIILTLTTHCYGTSLFYLNSPSVFFLRLNTTQQGVLTNPFKMKCLYRFLTTLWSLWPGILLV